MTTVCSEFSRGKRDRPLFGCTPEKQVFLSMLVTSKSYHAYICLCMLSTCCGSTAPQVGGRNKLANTLVINGISGVSPLITRVITHLLSGMNHQVGMVHLPTDLRLVFPVDDPHISGGRFCQRSRPLDALGPWDAAWYPHCGINP